MLRKIAETSYLVVPAVGILVVILVHSYFEIYRPLTFETRTFEGNRTHFEKLERAEKLVALTPEELDDIRFRAEQGLFGRLSPEEREAFPTAAELAEELTARYGAADREAVASFIVGVSHLADDEPQLAVRFFRSSYRHAPTRAAHLAIGYSLKVLGEDLASYDVYSTLKKEAQKAGDDTLLERAYQLSDPTTGRYNLMLGVGILVGAVFSVFLSSVMIAVWRRARRRGRMGILPNEWPSMRCALYLRRFRAAPDEESLDRLEEEIVPLFARRIDRFGGDDRPAPLREIRREAKAIGAEADARLVGEREYLCAVFLDTVGFHEKAQGHYALALRALDLPAIHLARGVSLLYMGKKGRARTSLQRALDRGAKTGEGGGAVSRAAGYLARL
ncbi:MAG: hypothetical protein HQK87_02820 [Nitrospinae bacterium]|nr:hypothetical protein [Nitrospinota bacterium]